MKQVQGTDSHRDRSHSPLFTITAWTRQRITHGDGSTDDITVESRDAFTATNDVTALWRIDTPGRMHVPINDTVFSMYIALMRKSALA